MSKDSFKGVRKQICFDTHENSQKALQRLNEMKSTVGISKYIIDLILKDINNDSVIKPAFTVPQQIPILQFENNDDDLSNALDLF